MVSETLSSTTVTNITVLKHANSIIFVHLKAFNFEKQEGFSAKRGDGIIFFMFSNHFRGSHGLMVRESLL